MGLSWGQLLKLQKFIYTDHSCPLINTGGITPWFKLSQKARLGRSGKAIKGFPGHLPGSENNYRKSTSKSVLLCGGLYIIISYQEFSSHYNREHHFF